jgi:hypothetical protein
LAIDLTDAYRAIQEGAQQVFISSRPKQKQFGGSHHLIADGTAGLISASELRSRERRARSLTNEATSELPIGNAGASFECRGIVNPIFTRPIRKLLSARAVDKRGTFRGTAR